jgi:GR25 family glycosyltransferase involved in LPS biosynthesis
MPLPVCVINLPEDHERLSTIAAKVGQIPGLELVRIPAVRGSDLPDLVCHFLTGNAWSHHYKGTLGVFCSHVKCWEYISKSEFPYGLVLEDDAILDNLSLLEDFTFPSDIDIVFCNDRTAYAPLTRDEGVVAPSSYGLLEIDPVLGFVAGHKHAVGGDGYLVSRKGAEKLLKFVSEDGLFTHVDLRLLAYCLNPGDAEELDLDAQSRNVVVLRNSFDVAHKLGARVLVPSISFHSPASASRRELGDRLGRGE